MHSGATGPVDHEVRRFLVLSVCNLSPDCGCLEGRNSDGYIIEIRNFRCMSRCFAYLDICGLKLKLAKFSVLKRSCGWRRPRLARSAKLPVSLSGSLIVGYCPTAVRSRWMKAGARLTSPSAAVTGTDAESTAAPWSRSCATAALCLRMHCSDWTPNATCHACRRSPVKRPALD